MAAESEKDVIARFWETIFNAPDTYAAMDEMFAADYKLHNLAYGETRNLDQLRSIVADVHSMLDGTRVTVEDQVIFAGDKVVTHLTIHFPARYAANAGQDYEPTDEWLDYNGISISRISEGKIQESWLLWDATRAAMEVVSPLEPWRWPPWR